MHINISVYRGMDWIHLAQDGLHWRVLVNTTITFLVPYKGYNILGG
jgi:hypothetical protein